MRRLLASHLLLLALVPGIALAQLHEMRQIIFGMD